MTDIKLNEFVEKMSRMCYTLDCDSCPLCTYPCSITDNGFLENLDAIVKNVYEWDKEHPQRKYNVRFMKYFDVEVAADNDDEAMLKAERISKDFDFNEGEDDYDLWIMNN